MQYIKKALPEADVLRFTTSKLGQFLELNDIETISIEEIVSRFILDLNLPSLFFINQKSIQKLNYN